MKKKAISPVVATALLLVVAVVAVVAFQTWFNNFQSGQLADVETKANAGSSLTIERLQSNGTFYVKNSDTSAITVNSISVAAAGNGTVICSSSTSATATASTVSVMECNSGNLITGVSYSVVLVTADGVFSAEQLAR